MRTEVQVSISIFIAILILNSPARAETKFAVLVGDKIPCEQVATSLSKSVEIRDLTIPSDHDAGSDLKFSLTINKREALSETEWMKDYSDVSLNSFIGGDR